MKRNNLENEKWEGLCKGCGKCCHCKYDLVVFALADPEYICKHLTANNRCEIYNARLQQKGCLPLKTAIKRDSLVPIGCGYFHINPNHRPLIFPETVEEFWKLIEVAQLLLNQKFQTNKEINLIDFIRKTRKDSKEFKLKDTGGFSRFF